MDSIIRILFTKAYALIFLAMTLINQDVFSQKFFTRDGIITFLSEAPLETIKAENKKVTCVLDLETGRIEFAVLIKAFQFKKALMQEHFNENYMESSKFPKAIFKGKIINFESLGVGHAEKIELLVEGDMTIRGITKFVTSSGVFEEQSDRIQARSEFTLMVEDWNIGIPSIVKDNISKVVTVQVAVDLDPFKK